MTRGQWKIDRGFSFAELVLWTIVKVSFKNSNKYYGNFRGEKKGEEVREKIVWKNSDGNKKKKEK